VSYMLVEPFAGSGALGWYKLGAKNSLLPYQGSKWRFRRQLESIMNSLGFAGAPDHVAFADSGPWGRVHGVLASSGIRGVIRWLRAFDRIDPRAVYEGLHGKPVADDFVEYAAQFLYLQRLAFSGKAVTEIDGKWVSPGFNKTSAYGKEATDRFGAINPQVPGLIRTLEKYAGLGTRRVISLMQDSFALDPENVGKSVAGPKVVYMDPGYLGQTGYPGGAHAIDDILTLARNFADHGMAVMVSMNRGLDELKGWEQVQLHNGRGDTSPFRGKNPEWVTYFAPRTLRG
jgi:site-specific DNA-adenine methylase